MILLSLLFAFTAQAQEHAFTSEGQKITTETLVKRDDVVWGFDFLKDGRIIFTERRGAINVFDPKTKTTTTLKGTPKVYAKGQGGMLDVRVHPQTEKVYFVYAEPVGDKATTTIAMATLQKEGITEFKKLWTADPATKSDIQFGSRIEFDGKGHVIFTVGDLGERDNAQSQETTTGKVIRLNEDGSIPKDNPFPKGVYALGLRSPEGLVYHPNGELWEAEMGPRGGDEINIIEAGKNYGWPKVTRGREYYGPKIGEPTLPGMVDPIVFWVPSISPAGITVYTGDKIPKWKGDVFLACLSGVQVRRVRFEGHKAVNQEKLLKGTDRYRQVRNGPDGYLYYSTDSGSLGRFVLAK